MYNQEIKEKYLAGIESESTQNQAISVLGRIGKYEDRYEKDVAFFNKEEVEQFLLSGRGSVRTRYNASAIIRNYVLWYYKNIEGVEKNDLWKFSTKEIEEKMSSAEDNTSDLLTKDFVDYIVSLQENPVNKLIIYSLYHGISGISLVELATLTQESILSENELQLLDFDGEFLVTGRKIQVPEYLIQILKQSCETYSLQGTTYRRGSARKQDYILYGAYGIKTTTKEEEIMRLGSKCSNQWLRKRYQIILNRLENSILPTDHVKLTANLLLNSGFINTLAVHGFILKIKPKEVLSHPVFEQIGYQYGKAGQDINNIKYVYKKYLQ